MNPRQKNLLKEYITITDPAKTVALVKKESASLARELYNLAKFQKNKVTAVKLQEVAKSFKSYQNKTRINDHDLTCLMIGYQLAEELK